MNVGEKCFIYMDTVLNDFHNNSALVRNATTNCDLIPADRNTSRGFDSDAS